MSKKMDIRVWVEGTLVAAMAMALSFIPLQSLNASLDLSLGMVPLVLYSYRRGLIPGLTAGFVWGLLSIISGNALKYMVSVPQIIFEYPFAFAFAGMAGIFARQVQQAISADKTKKAITYVVIGGIVAAFSRWFWHFWAGVFVWGAYAPEGMSPYWYSFTLNGASFLMNAIYIAVVLGILVSVAPSLFVVKTAPQVFSAKK
ncbi:energy-coupled thiamine transporter ThiT [Enterococcus sp. HY326]|uniref:energy-coupled thiamine transporter ThiT n=1 Tax=Enterococcus sp. HY326 TaxID=2971265 RepID=UPI00223ED6C8|nr:energy-coupled thiamine transporter ThiT [Enterococcus sp. HY326]